MAAVLLFAGAALLSAGVALKVDIPTGVIVAGVLFLVAGIDATRDVVKPKATARPVAVAPGPNPDPDE